MDVSLSGTRVLAGILALLSLFLISCGNRYDLTTERGRRARIDDANFHLSNGKCGAAAEAIDPLYYSVYATDEVRIIKASTFGCYAHFNLLTFVSSLASESNQFKAMAKSLDNVAGDGARGYMYSATDVITRGAEAYSAGSRSRRENTFMVFLQFGVISAILRNYGAPTSDGSQVNALVYETAGANPLNEMSNEDACALGAAYSHIADSFGASDLSDASTVSIVNSLNDVCEAMALPSCAAINKIRSACNGTNGDSVNAATIVGGVNTSW
jgi:hypothetical protein